MKENHTPDGCWIDGEFIAATGKGRPSGIDADESVDACGALLMPGRLTIMFISATQD